MNTCVVSPSSQLQKMKEKKGLYPDKSVYTQQIGPGFCFGALALMLRFFFEVPVCTLTLPDSKGYKGHHQERDTPTHTTGLHPASHKTHLRVGMLVSGSRDKGPLCLSPSPDPFGAGGAQGDSKWHTG